MKGGSRSIPVADLDYLADCDTKILVAIADFGLPCLPPTPIEQDARGLQTHGVGVLWLHDRRKNADVPAVYARHSDRMSAGIFRRANGLRGGYPLLFAPTS